ncbi:MBL fold metallo-hydrolase [Thermodesulfobacteriota bacterium]
MWIQDAGEINDRLILLGTRQNTSYLVKGKRHMLVGIGGQWVVPELERQIREFHIDMDRVQYLLIAHTHFDHSGAVPYFQKRYPHLEVLASREALKVFAMKKAVRNMRIFSRRVMEDLGLSLEYEGISLDFDGVEVAQGLQGGDRVDLGDGLYFDVYEAPGHSRCSMILYAPDPKWLFPSDSLSIPVGDGNEFAFTALDNFSEYLDSLKKLEDLEIRLCAWEHYGVMTNDDIQDIVKRSIRFTLEHRRRLLDLLDKSGDQEEIAQWATREWLEKTRFDFVPFDVKLHIYRGIVKNALEEQIEEADYI